MKKIILLLLWHISYLGYAQKDTMISSCKELYVEGFFVKKYAKSDYPNLKVKRKGNTITYTKKYDYKVFTFFIPKDSVKEEKDLIRKLGRPYIINKMPIYEIPYKDRPSYITQQYCSNLDSNSNLLLITNPKVRYVLKNDQSFIYEIYYLKGKWLEFIATNTPISLRYFDNDYALRYIDKKVSQVQVLSLINILNFEELKETYQDLIPINNK